MRTGFAPAAERGNDLGANLQAFLQSRGCQVKQQLEQEVRSLARS